jgi:lipopolysaccharide transport system permease protein
MPHNRPVIPLVRKLVDHQYVLRNFIARDLKVKYRGTVLGYLWSLLEPMSLVAIYWFLFIVVMDVKDPIYPLTVVLGVLPYNLLSSIINSGASALIGNSGLIKRVYIPREIFVLSAIGSNIIVYGLSMLIVIPLLGLYKIVPGAQLLWLAPAMISMVLFATGVAMFLACANVIYRDVGYLVRVGMRIYFYASPVIYSLDRVQEPLREWYLLNPAAVWISIHRDAILERPLGVEPRQILVAAVISILVFFAGTLFFERYEKKAVKFL